MTQDLYATPHRRLNQLTGEWVLVSPHRTARPWQGQQEAAPVTDRPAYDPDCYLCPGNSAPAATAHPGTPAPTSSTTTSPRCCPTGSTSRRHTAALLVAEPERGLCRVICFAPRHDVTLAAMTGPEIRRVVDTWTEQYRELGQQPWSAMCRSSRIAAR